MDFELEVETCCVSFLDSRHLENVEEKLDEANPRLKMDERMKTLNYVLVVCLNVGVDPPDFIKPNPCARMECWIDPLSISRQKALETIGNALHKLYHRWQSRARYRFCLDPTVDDVKKQCTSLRQSAKDDRVLFHYNGHGVPKPTQNGEIWVFNRNQSPSQYIPLSIFDLQMWMGAPSVYVWDCNCAGQIVDSFKNFGDLHNTNLMSNEELKRNFPGGLPAKFPDLNKVDGSHQIAGGLSGFVRGSSSALIEESENFHARNSASNLTGGCRDSSPPLQLTSLIHPAPNFRHCIHLAACQADETLPTNAELPADLFTSCLTSPVKSAVMWYILQNGLADRLPLDIVDKLPGQPNDKRTLIGELNWTFTATTDTIAWHVLPRDLFHKLFRQDLLVACLFRNFLLADRIMRHYGCTPVSYPSLPATHEHPMWQAWDFSLDICLSNLIHNPSLNLDLSLTALLPSRSAMASSMPPVVSDLSSLTGEKAHSPFFAHQLTAFEVWLQHGLNRSDPPLQLPVVLQVLLSQSHRIRALELLEKFLDLGPWAINVALSVGIFAYVLKLLQCLSVETRPHLTFIWAKIMAVDPACQLDLVREGGHRYFLQILNDPSVSEQQKTAAAFVIARLMDSCYAEGQNAVMSGGFLTTCADLLSDCKQALLKRWLCLGLACMWRGFDAARWQAIRCCTYDKLYELLTDSAPETRAAAVHALGALLSNRSDNNEHATTTCHSIALILVQTSCADASPLVRRELLVALHWLVLNFHNQFVTVAYETTEKKLDALARAQARLTYGSTRVQHRLTSDVRNFGRRPNKTAVTPQKSAKYPPRRDSCESNNGEDTTDGTFPAVKNRCRLGGSIADNLCIDSLLLDDDDKLSMKESTQSLNRRPSTEKLTKVATFTKLLGFGGGSTVQNGGTGQAKRHQQRKDSLPISLEGRLRSSTSSGNVYVTVWRVLLNFCFDPQVEVSQVAEKIVERVKEGVAMLHKSKIEEEMDWRIAQATSSPERRSSDLKTSDSTDDDLVLNDCKPVFVIGSPDSPACPVSPQNSVTLSPSAPRPSAAGGGSHVQRLRSSARQKLLDDSNGGNRRPPTISVYSTIFTSPRRPVFGGRPSPTSPPSTSAAEVVRTATFNGAARTTTLSAAAMLTTLPTLKPLVESTFVPWCCKKMAQPTRRWLADGDHATDGVGLSQNCDNMTRLSLNDWSKDLKRSSQTRLDLDRKILKDSSKFDNQVFTIRSNRAPTCLKFFPFHPLLCVAESGGFLNFCNLDDGQRTINFENDTNQSKSDVIFIDLVNPCHNPLIMTGTEDGEVRIWDCRLANWSENFDLPTTTLKNGRNISGRPRLVTSWNTVPFWLKSKLLFTSVYFWEQDSALLMTAGDSNVISMWDTHQERKTCELTLPAFGGQVTSLSGDSSANQVLVAGCSDGSVRLFDRRLPSKTTSLATGGKSSAATLGNGDVDVGTGRRQGSAAVVRVLAQQGAVGSRIVGCTADGRVRVWDPRVFRDPLTAFDACETPAPQVDSDRDYYPDDLAVDIHPSLDLIAVGHRSDHNRIRLATFDGRFLEPVQYHDGFMGQRLTSVQCLAFHQNAARLACGSRDGLTCVFGPAH